MTPVRIQPLLERRPRTRLRRWLAVLVALFLIAAAWHGWNIWKARSVAGLYLMPDGISYVVLKPGFWPALEAPEGLIWTSRFLLVSSELSIHARFGWSQMVLRQTETMSESFPAGTAKARSTVVLRLKRSKTTPGDWDLVFASLSQRSNSFAVFVNPLATPASSVWVRVKDSLERFIISHSMPVVRSGELDPAKAPIPSFLHRMPDARLAAYCSRCARGVESDEDLAILREMTGKDPLNIHLGLRRVALEAQKGNLEESGKAWEKCNAAYGASAHPLLRGAADRARRILDTAKWWEEYPALATVWQQANINAPSWALLSLPERLQWLRDLSKTDSLYPGVERPMILSSVALQAPKFLNLQITAKTVRVESLLCLFQGDKTRSLEMLAGTYWMGQSLNAGDTVISKLIGIAMRAIATGGLQLHTLDGCQSPEDLRVVWDTLEKLANLPGQETGSSLLDGELSLITAQMKMSGLYARNFQEVHTRHKVADAGFSVLRTAVAARHRFLAAGVFPASPAEFGPLLPGGPLGDCFTTSAPLRFLSKPDGFHIYSVGPDGRDDAGAILYDPTNGSVSRGDISLRIPREREYPFPAGGVRVNTAAELLRLFPNGLPPDPFADTRGRPLSIIASSEADWKSCALPGVKTAPAPPAATGPGEPGYTPAPAPPPASPSAPPPAPPSGADAPTTPTQVVIFSFGPDTDESNYMSFPRLTGKDVFTTHSMYSTPLQLVFSPARLVMQPYYDPTNGTTSKGNLYLEIPRP